MVQQQLEAEHVSLANESPRKWFVNSPKPVEGRVLLTVIMIGRTGRYPGLFRISRAQENHEMIQSKESERTMLQEQV